EARAHVGFSELYLAAGGLRSAVRTELSCFASLKMTGRSPQRLERLGRAGWLADPTGAVAGRAGGRLGAEQHDVVRSDPPRVAAKRPPDRPAGGRLAELAGDPAVGPHLAARDLERPRQDGPLEVAQGLEVER